MFDRPPDFVAELLRVAELPEQAALLHRFLEAPECFKLGRVYVVWKWRR